jgi:hypothetical protein
MPLTVWEYENGPDPRGQELYPWEADSTLYEAIMSGWLIPPVEEMPL